MSSEVTKKDLKEFESRLGARIDEQGAQLREEIKESGAQLREEIKESGDQLRKEMKESGAQLRKEMQESGDQLRSEIKEQGVQLRKEMQESGAQLRKEMQESGDQLRKEIKESADSVLEVINVMATSSSNQFLQINQKLDDLTTELMLIKRQINNINSDIDRAFKNKAITEEETIALIAGQQRLERWVEQIAKESGIKLAV